MFRGAFALQARCGVGLSQRNAARWACLCKQAVERVQVSGLRRTGPARDAPFFVEILLQRSLLYLDRIFIQQHLTLEQFLVPAPSGGRNGGIRQMHLGAENSIGIVMAQDVKAAKCIGLSTEGDESQQGTRLRLNMQLTWLSPA